MLTREDITGGVEHGQGESSGRAFALEYYNRSPVGSLLFKEAPSGSKDDRSKDQSRCRTSRLIRNLTRKVEQTGVNFLLKPLRHFVTDS